MNYIFTKNIPEASLYGATQIDQSHFHNSTGMHNLMHGILGIISCDQSVAAQTIIVIHM